MFTMKGGMAAVEVQWTVPPAGPVGLPPGDLRMQDHLVIQVPGQHRAKPSIASLEAEGSEAASSLRRDLILHSSWVPIHLGTYFGTLCSSFYTLQCPVCLCQMFLLGCTVTSDTSIYDF